MTTDTTTVTPDFTLDDEFSTLCPVVDREERELLRASLLAHGVREPLVVWKEERLLLDGHRRLLLCREHELEFPVIEYSFPDRHAARSWIIDNALGRRNLTEEQRRYLRGKRLLAEKRPEGRPAKLPQSEGVLGETAERIARSEGVSRATVERDAEYARAVDKISETCPKARAAILTGELKLSREQVSRVAAEEVPPRSFAQIKRVARAVARSAKSRTLPRVPGTETKERLVRDVEGAGHALSTLVRLYDESGYDIADLRALAGIAAARRALEALDAPAAAEKVGRS